MDFGPMKSYAVYLDPFIKASQVTLVSIDGTHLLVSVDIRPAMQQVVIHVLDVNEHGKTLTNADDEYFREQVLLRGVSRLVSAKEIEDFVQYKESLIWVLYYHDGKIGIFQGDWFIGETHPLVRFQYDFLDLNETRLPTLIS